MCTCTYVYIYIIYRIIVQKNNCCYHYIAVEDRCIWATHIFYGDKYMLKFEIVPECSRYIAKDSELKLKLEHTYNQFIK
jgi:hypothetical protein